MAVDTPRTLEATDILTPEEGGGPPVGSAWTLEILGDDGWSADLEHAAPLPRIGERIEFIEEDGRKRAYRVTDIIHTLQPSSSTRPTVAEEASSPNSIVTDGAEEDPPRALRAGLPRVMVVAEED
jgi:hypothetical protein